MVTDFSISKMISELFHWDRYFNSLYIYIYHCLVLMVNCITALIA